MKIKRSALWIGAILAISMSLSWCLYVILNQGTGYAGSQSTIVKGHPATNMGTSNLGSSSQGQLLGQDNNQSKTVPNGHTFTDGHFRPNGQPFSNQPMSRMSGGQGANTGNSDTAQIIGYSIVFFLAVLAAYFALVRRNVWQKVKVPEDHLKILFITLFCVGFLLRIVLGILIGGHSSDLNLFRSWAASAANNFSQFYSGRISSDYPPLYIYILYVVGKICSSNAMTPYSTIFLKLPSILADMGTAFLLSKLARNYLSTELSLLVAAFYILNPAVFVDSAIWGQVDSFFTLIVLSGIVLLSEQKLIVSSIFFTAAVLMKPQGIIFLPVLFFDLVRRKRFKDVLQVLITAVVTALLLVLPFSTSQNVFWIVKLFSSTLGEYPYASVNAFNFFYLIGANYTKDASTVFLVSYHVWGTAFIVITTLAAWFLFARAKDKNFVAAAALILITGVFIFSTRMHERYLFPAVALAVLAFIYLKDRRLIILAAGFSLTSFGNTFAILSQSAIGINRAAVSLIPMLISALNVILLIYLIKVCYAQKTQFA